MLGTMTNKQKISWKEHVSTMTQAYNKRYSPVYVIFGRHPRLAIDTFLGLQDRDKKPKHHKNYAEQLKGRMAMTYKEAGIQAA